MLRVGAVGAAWAWGLLILVLTLLPSQAVPGGGLLGRYHLDKAAHVALFAVFVVLLGRALVQQGVGQALSKAMVLGLAYGLLTELLQEWMGQGRHGDVWDLLADGAGVILGAVWARWGTAGDTYHTDRS